MRSDTDPDNPQMKAAWTAFLADLEEEAQAYTDEIVDAFRQIDTTGNGQVQESSVLDEVYRILHEANPHHDRRGRFTRGGSAGRKTRGPVTDAVSAAVGGVGDGSATPRAVSKILDTAGVQKSKKVSKASAVGTKTNLVFHKTDGPGYSVRAHPSGQGTLVEFHGSSGTIDRHRRQTTEAFDKAGVSHKPPGFGNGIHVTSMFSSKPITPPAAPGAKRISATVGVTNNLLKSHQFKAVSLSHGGVRLVHTGKLTGPELHRAESDAIQHLEGHGAKFRYHKPTGETHLTHFENPTEEAASTHIARVKTQKARATKIERGMSANEQATDARVKMLKWHEQREADITKAKQNVEELHVAHRRAAEKWWATTVSSMSPEYERMQADMNRLGREHKAAVEHHANLVSKLNQDLKEKFIYQKPADIRMEPGKGQKMSERQKEEWKAGFEEFRKIVGPSMNYSITVHENMVNHPNLTPAALKELGIPKKKTVYFFNTSDDRSFNRMGQVHMSGSARREVVVHELGHTLEYETPAIAKSRREFYDERTRGESERKLKEITGNRGYDDHELARADDFTHAYMGKDYGGHLKGTSEDRHSEMVSMGVQLLHQDPVKLARQDPEYFDWIYSVTRGRAAEWHPAPRFVHGDTVRLTGGTHKGKTARVTGKGFPGTGTEEGQTIHSVEIPGVGLWTVNKGNMVRVA